MDDGLDPYDDGVVLEYSAEELEERMEVVAQAIRKRKNVAPEDIAKCIEFGMHEAPSFGSSRRIPFVPRDVLAYAVKVLRGEMPRRGRQYRPWEVEKAKMMAWFTPWDFEEIKAQGLSIEEACRVCAQKRLTEDGATNPDEEQLDRLAEKIRRSLYWRPR